MSFFFNLAMISQIIEKGNKPKQTDTTLLHNSSMASIRVIGPRQRSQISPGPRWTRDDNCKLIKELSRRGAIFDSIDLQCTIYNGFPGTLLDYIEDDNWDLLRSFFIDRLPTTCITDYQGFNLLHYAIYFNSNTVAANLIREFSAELCSAVTWYYGSRNSSYLCTPLHIAISKGNVPMIKLLIQCKHESVFAVRHFALRSEDSALHAAIRYPSKEDRMAMLDLVLQISCQREDLAGLDLINVVGNGNHQTGNSQTLLQFAIMEEQYDSIEGLLLRGSIFKQKWILSLQREDKMKVMKIVKKCVIAQKEWMRVDQSIFTSLPRDVVEVIWTFVFSRYYSVHQRILQLEKFFPDIQLM